MSLLTPLWNSQKGDSFRNCGLDFMPVMVVIRLLGTESCWNVFQQYWDLLKSPRKCDLPEMQNSSFVNYSLHSETLST